MFNKKNLRIMSHLVYLLFATMLSSACVEEDEVSAESYDGECDSLENVDAPAQQPNDEDIVIASEETQMTLSVAGWRMKEIGSDDPAEVEALDSTGTPLARLELQDVPNFTDRVMVRGLSPLEGEVLLFLDGTIEGNAPYELYDFTDALWRDFESSGLVGDISAEDDSEPVEITQVSEALTGKSSIGPCHPRTGTVRESYWCWKGIFHWRCYRTVHNTVWVCNYWNQHKSCYGVVETHSACGRGEDGRNYSFSWTDACLGYYSNNCGDGSGIHTFSSVPSVSQGCSSSLYDCP
jgi:hypothetical protein